MEAIKITGAIKRYPEFTLGPINMSVRQGEFFGIFGPPAIMFFDTDGNERRNYRVVGYVPADQFAPHVRSALNR